MHHEIEGVDLFQGLNDERGSAFFQRDQERQMRFLAAGLLQDGVDVDAGLVEDGGERGDDAGAVLHEKTQVVAGYKVGGQGGRLLAGLRFAVTSGARPVRDCRA